jgi:predicted methyltransferase
MKITAYFLVVMFGLLASTLLAHHSFEAEFDRNKTVQIKGAVTQLEWTNPHAHLYIDSKDDTGHVTNWNFELGSPNLLRRMGWTKEALHPGDIITVEGYRAKDGSNLANARKITMADGKQVFAGSSAEGSLDATSAK